jgi:carbon monoxide dehydrogenase subunit G
MKGERALPADRRTAWAAINDIEVLKKCVPGCERLAPIEGHGNQYEIALTAAIGPVRSRFKGKLEMADIVVPESYTLKFDGSGGAAGFARSTARVSLAEIAPTQTRLSYAVEAHVGGKLAQVGSRLIDAASAAMADQFFSAFEEHVKARAKMQLEETTLVVEHDITRPLPGAPATSFSLWAFLKNFFGRLFGGK